MPDTSSARFQFDKPPIFLAVTPPGVELAKRLRAVVPNGLIHGRVGRVDGVDDYFGETTAHVAKLFAQGHPIIGIFASGILIRALGAHLGDKVAEPPVIAVAEDGSAVVPLLGGHSGANRLARHLAAALHVDAAITTTGDLRIGIGIDDPPPGWQVANRKKSLPVAAAILAGEAVRLRSDAGSADWLQSSALTIDDAADLGIWVTDQAVPESSDDLVLHPPTLAIGVGCERGASADEVITLVQATLRDAGLSPVSVAAIGSIDVKMDEPAVHELAKFLGVPVRFFDAKTLESETPRLQTPSDVVFNEVGCHGVSEGAALSLSGPEGTLIVGKKKSTRATCAIARAPQDIVPEDHGFARGRLTVIGTGPGTVAWRTPAVNKAVAEASDVVGYGLYLDILGDTLQGKQLHSSDLSFEEARARKALDLAGQGRNVVLVSSGDPGIYALATLVMELLDREDRFDWNRAEVSVEPGVSAFQAASARAGAPMGHDFCLISLSDLLTPWETIETRLQAAATGDFTIAFYNPVSKRRRWQLEKARDILLSARPADTPVLLARNLGRDEETLTHVTLDSLKADDVDMLTLVLVGASQTRRMTRGENTWLYTPRGYAKKMSEPAGDGEACPVNEEEAQQ